MPLADTMWQRGIRCTDNRILLIKKEMAKRVDPLLSVTGNFGRYGGAHNVRATAIGATSRGPHNTLYFRGVIRATDEEKQALREKSDQKSEVTRRMNHGAEAYIDPRGRTVLPLSLIHI